MSDINMSAEIGELASALAMAQGEITGALKDSKNPFFKSSYADLASCWDACRGPLSKNGLAVIQTTQEYPDGVKVLTTLAHKSGQWIRGELPMKPTKNDPQGIGSCLTYARRYALAGIVGLAQIDDDANAASGKDNKVDPKGDAYKQADQKLRDEYVKRVKDALHPDIPEDVTQGMLYDIHLELAKDNELYIAVGAALGSKDANAFKKYVELTKSGKKAA